MLAWALLGVIGVISVWTPPTRADIAARWFSFPNLLWFAPVPVLLSMVGLLRSLRRETHSLPFVLTLVLVFLGYTGLGISVWPNVVPPDITIWDAAGPPQSLGFALVGALLITPMILMYTAWSYWVFRGKVVSVRSEPHCRRAAPQANMCPRCWTVDIPQSGRARPLNGS